MSLGRDAIDGSVIARALLRREGKFDGPMQALVRNDTLGGSVLDARVRLNASNVRKPALAHWAIPWPHRLIQADRLRQSSLVQRVRPECALVWECHLLLLFGLHKAALF